MLRRYALMGLALCLVLCFFVSSCKQSDSSSEPKDSKTVILTLWIPNEEKELFNELIDLFLTAQKTNRPEVNYTIQIESQSKESASDLVIRDASEAADVFMFSSRQFLSLVKNQALASVVKNPSILRANNTTGAVKTATDGTDLYAYPLSVSDGEILYYDKSVFTKADVETLNGILEVLEKSTRKFAADLTNPRQIGGFFLGAGCKLTLQNKKQWLDFNNSQGLKAAVALQTLCESVSFVNADEYTVKTQTGQSIAAAFGNVSLANGIKDSLGENFSTATLPTFSMDGRETPIYSFMEYTLLGVNKKSKNADEAMELAAFLTNEQCQLRRFQKYKIAPTNRNTAAHSEFKKEDALSSLVAQSEKSQSIGEVVEDFWTPMNDFGTALLDARHKSRELLQQLLNELVNRIMD